MAAARISASIWRDELRDLRRVDICDSSRARLAPAVRATGLGHGAQPVVDVADALDDRLRHDAVLLVVFLLDLPPAVRLVDRDLHRFGDAVGVHDDLAADVARGAADDLDERPRRAQEALLVGVEDRDERHLGQVDALAQQVDADEHVVDAEAQVAQDLRRARACRPREWRYETLTPISCR